LLYCGNRILILSELRTGSESRAHDGKAPGMLDSAPVLRRRNLPHWDVPGATYFVTSCLEGSIPARGLLDLARYRQDLDARERPADVSEEEWDRRRWKLEFARLDDWLDREPAVRWMERPELAQRVMNSLLHFASERYEVLAFVVMPSHFHWAFRPLPAWVESLPDIGQYRSPRERIMYSIRRFTGRRCNEVLDLRGGFWQPESYDHWVRDADELDRIICYIENNPVKAGLVKNAEDWRWSSAHVRRILGLRFGSPIPKAEGSVATGF
jgi:putative transposase